LLLMAAFLTVFLFGAALAVDLAATAARGQTLQNTADAASLAGVVEYQEQLTNGASDADARAAAEVVIRDIMTQNDIDPADPDITWNADFVAGGVVTVSIHDDDPDSFLAGVVGVDPEVERAATAEFIACNTLCNVSVDIPKPFGTVDATGDGDGYKPIAFEDDRIFAINHNTDTGTNGQIVCIDRFAQEGCWEDIAGNAKANQNAYVTSLYSEESPEMPQAAVVGNQIYWSATHPFKGHQLFCFNVHPSDRALDAPCTSSITMSDDPRGVWQSSPLAREKDENRGGGTFALNDKVFVFTDNHEIHCYDPIAGGYCAGYTGNYGGMPTRLDRFPDNDPSEGNHGSSIDRIIDSSTGRVYSTIHVVSDESNPCTQSIAEADLAGEQVVIVNRQTGNYLSMSSPAIDQYGVTPAADGTASGAWWDLSAAGTSWQFAPDDYSGYYLHGEVAVPETSPGPSVSHEWNLSLDGSGDHYLIEYEAPGFAGFLTENQGLNDITKENVPQGDLSSWLIVPEWCGDPELNYYAPGTWLHCYDTGVISGTPQPCSNFDARRVDGSIGPIHEDSTRFSGRLWFYYSTGLNPTKLGVCSSGYDGTNPPQTSNFMPLAVGSSSTIEIRCVDMSGDFSASMSNTMQPVRDAIRASTADRPGAWGDPHWSKFTNRLFYPTEHDTPLIICWDFANGSWCGTRIGTVPPNPTGEVFTEDYGFFSEEDCVYGLGHHALMWSFRASDINKPCVGTTARTPIQKCPCGDGTISRWGVLDFSDVDLGQYDVFKIQITTSPENDADPTNDDDIPTVLFPLDASGNPIEYSLKPGGANPLLDLDNTANIDPTLEWIEIKVYIETQLPPTALQEAAYTVTFRQLPRLID